MFLSKSDGGNDDNDADDDDENCDDYDADDADDADDENGVDVVNDDDVDDVDGVDVGALHLHHVALLFALLVAAPTFFILKTSTIYQCNDKTSTFIIILKIVLQRTGLAVRFTFPEVQNRKGTVGGLQRTAT